MENLLKINNVDEFIIKKDIKKEEPIIINNINNINNINDINKDNKKEEPIIINNTNDINDINKDNKKEETIIINNINDTNDINKDNKKEETIINNINWWYPSVNGKKRILWAGTHIHQSNGYSRVMYYITKFLGSYEDIELTIY
jgi:hypothetical protein